MNFKVSVVKKNQILTWSVALMLVVAGYLNYRNDVGENYESQATGVIDENLGDAVFVDSNSLVMNQEEENHSDFFSESRINRNNQYAMQVESYEKLLKDTSISEEQKEFLTKEIKRINDEKNAISIAENLIKLKGIEEVVILMNQGSVNVVIFDENQLEEGKIAQIQNIVQNELKVQVENIHISEGWGRS